MLAIQISTPIVYIVFFLFRLQSYFYKKENLLSGLIFNKENIKIRPEYENVLRFYGYDLDGASNMLTESKMNETTGNMTDVTEATDSAMSTSGNETKTDADEKPNEENLTTALPSEASDSQTPTTDEVSGAEENTEDNTQTDDENEDVTTVAPASRKRRGRLGRGLKAKNRRDRKQSPVIKSPVSRHSRSYYVLLDEDYENDFHLDSSSPSSAAPQGPTSTVNPISMPHGTYRNNNPADLFENAHSDTVEHIFYLGDFEVRCPFKLYDTVMKYAHIESLQASVFEIALDTDSYDLLIMRPDHPDGLSDLTSRLSLHESSTLRRIRNSMDFYWVKTIVPKFSLKGNTLLTNDLQNVSPTYKLTEKGNPSNELIFSIFLSHFS